MTSVANIPTHFIKRGSAFFVANAESNQVSPTLPVGNYIIGRTPTGDFYLDRVDSFTPVPKLYGNTTKHASRIIRTFLDRSAATGVMLVGEKGSGKTLLSRQLAMDGAALGIPTIIINAPWCGDAFNQFIQSLTQPCIILFDEFEKVYDREDQEKILTLLDGVFPSKKMFVLTTNDKYRVDVHMRNRPGRIYYMIEFGGLDEEFIREYCADNLNNKDHVDGLCRVALAFDVFCFDVLKALVEEMNRYGETASEATELLNTKPDLAGDQTYDVMSLVVAGVAIAENMVDDKYWRGNPLRNSGGLTIDYYVRSKEEGEEPDMKRAVFEQADLQQIDVASGNFKYANKVGDVLVLKRQSPTGFDYRNLF